MALVNDQSSSDINNANKDLILDSKNSGNGSNLDAEKGSRNKYGRSGNTAGGRIGPVLSHLKGYDFGSDDSGSDILGKQLEMEANDAIQYRTCSWPKVCCFGLSIVLLPEKLYKFKSKLYLR